MILFFISAYFSLFMYVLNWNVIILRHLSSLQPFPPSQTDSLIFFWNPVPMNVLYGSPNFDLSGLLFFGLQMKILSFKVVVILKELQPCYIG